MKLTKYIYLAAMLVAAFAATACSSDDIIADEPANDVDELKTYTMTVEASKGEEFATRALALDGNMLNATWQAGEEVTVYNVTKSQELGGKLVAQSDGASTTLEGTLTGDIEQGDKLTLNFLSPDYDGQDGTLEYIAAHCDYAKASVNVAGIESGEVKTTGIATFENQQAIVKFKLRENKYQDDLYTKQLVVSDGTNVYNVSSSSWMIEAYVALPNISNKDIILYANDGLDCYGYHKSGVTFENGKYYEIKVTMKWSEDLGDVKTEKTVNSGDILHGRSSSKGEFSIADGAVVILDGAEIEEGSGIWAGLNCLGDATIILKGNNKILGTVEYPGIFVPKGHTLTILGDGSLAASGRGEGAGIGGGYRINCGNIVIKGGTITANGGTFAAGIGVGDEATCGNITIEGGTVTATGGKWAAGIGSGYGGSCGDITITTRVTSVTATKGEDAPNSIGYGDGGSCGTVNIGEGYIIGSIPNSTYNYDPTAHRRTIVEWTGETLFIEAMTIMGRVVYQYNENIGGSGIDVTWSGGGEEGNGWCENDIRITTTGQRLTFTNNRDEKKIAVIDIDTDGDIKNEIKWTSGWAANKRKILWIGEPSKSVDLYWTEGEKIVVYDITKVRITLVDN
ncbi:MAG: hypothetical protein K6F20_08355 [Bacteroidaceae bacterium]|nr:hypothetical protein [Bacteroidaceae bacterium]